MRTMVRSPARAGMEILAGGLLVDGPIPSAPTGIVTSISEVAPWVASFFPVCALMALFNFVVHNYSANWRQWVGVNWGFNATFDHESNFSYRRNGGTLGLFLDF